jgi:hypothetical protein
MKEITIWKGRLCRFAGSRYGVTLPSLEFQVRDLDGSLLGLDVNYSGPGSDNRDQVAVGRGDSVSLAFYLVDLVPTLESVERHEGFVTRLSQLRAAYPTKASSDYQTGWRLADRHLRDETPDAHRRRVREIREQREDAKIPLPKHRR